MCCDAPDVKNEGCVTVDGVRKWEYHCFNCGKGWVEEEKKEVDKPKEASSVETK